MRSLIAILGALALALTACSASSDTADVPFDVPGAPVATTIVDLPKSYRFEPAIIAVSVGDAVTWTNNDDFPHNVHLVDGTDRRLDLPIDESAELVFEESGDFYYDCSLHPQQMRGKVVVG